MVTKWLASGSASKGVLLVGGLAVAAHAIGVLGAFDETLFPLLGVVAFGATVLGAWVHRPATRWPYVCIASALLLFLVGSGLRVSLDTLGDLTAQRSLLPDLVSLPGYAMLGAGLWGFVRAHRFGTAVDIDVFLDGAIGAVGSLALAWVALVAPAVGQAGTPVSVRVVLISYAPMSAFLFIVTIRLTLSSTGRSGIAHRLLIGAMASMFIGDLIFMAADLGTIGVPPTLLDVPYAAGYLLSAACFAHPSMRELTEPAVNVPNGAGSGRLAVVAASLLVPAVLEIRTGTRLDRLVLALLGLVITALVTIRLARAMLGHATSQAELRHQSLHDSLTGLPNRLLAAEYIEGRLRPGGSQVAIGFLDIDRFKLVNDTLGHGVGDELLIAVSQRLQKVVSQEGLVARVGGDEFILVFGDVPDDAAALAAAERARLAIVPSFQIRGAEVCTSASVGVSMACPGLAGADAESLIRDADTAMYQAKDAGRDSVALFDATMRSQVEERVILDRDLRHVLERDELSIHYQPIVSLASGNVIGLEALLRWQHTTLGEVPPAKFVPIAEENGLIDDIGAWVLHEACRAVADWRLLPGCSGLAVSVNLSARQLRTTGFADLVNEALAGLPGSALRLELTESLLIDSRTSTNELFAGLRQRGIGLSVDDFGTGYSSLAYLKRFPVDVVKIDQSFIAGVDDSDSSEASLVAAIIAMADALGMRTVAEGIETAAQATTVTSLGCDVGQGYFFSRPLPAAEVPSSLEWLRAGASLRLQ